MTDEFEFCLIESSVHHLASKETTPFQSTQKI